jgi:RNHCP domain
MEPIAVTVRGKGRWVLIHRCTNCGRLRLNRIAGDDNLLLLMQLAALPLTMPPFPFGGLPAGVGGEVLDRASGQNGFRSGNGQVAARVGRSVPDLDE